MSAIKRLADTLQNLPDRARDLDDAIAVGWTPGLALAATGLSTDLMPPGWQEPAPALQAYVNRQAWDSLPPDLQAIIEISCQAITTDMQSEYSHGNAVALEQLMQDPNVEVRQFPDDVLQYLKSIAQEIVEEMVADDPMAARIHESWSAFLEKSIPNQHITEHAFLSTRI